MPGKYTRSLFLIGKTYVARNQAKEQLNQHLNKMRSSIIRMRLGYKDIEILREKIDELVDWERKYARVLKSEDNEILFLKGQLKRLENELKLEREEKERMSANYKGKISSLAESIIKIRGHIEILLKEKVVRKKRYESIENKIKMDLGNYYITR